MESFSWGKDESSLSSGISVLMKSGAINSGAIGLISSGDDSLFGMLSEKI